jgi:hypothetical protein
LNLNVCWCLEFGFWCFQMFPAKGRRQRRNGGTNSASPHPTKNRMLTQRRRSQKRRNRYPLFSILHLRFPCGARLQRIPLILLILSLLQGWARA